MMQHVRLALFLSVVCRSVVLLSGGGAVEAEQAAGEECVYKWKEQGSKDSKGVGVIGVSGRVHRARCRRLCGVVFSCVCFWCGLAWLACFLACWGGTCVSVVGWGVVGCGLGCGTGCAGRHGGAPSRSYLGGTAHTKPRFRLKSPSFPFCLQSQLLLLCPASSNARGWCNVVGK